MSTEGRLQQLMRERQQVSKEWNVARQAEVEQERARIEPAQLKADAEMRAAALDEQIRQEQLTQDAGYNNMLIAKQKETWAALRVLLDDPTKALTPSAYRLVEQLNREHATQQAHINECVSRYHNAYPDRTAALRNPDFLVQQKAEQELSMDVQRGYGRFSNSLPEWAFFKAWVSEARDSKLRIYRQSVSYAHIGELLGGQVLNPAENYSAQADVDNQIRGSRRRGW